MTAQFESIYQGLLSSPGKLRIAASGMGWKSNDDTVPVTTVAAADIKWIQWIRVARNFQLRLGTSGANQKSKITFDGFVRDDLERLSNLCKQYYNTTIEIQETSVKGWNWGVAEVQSQDLSFQTTSRTAFTIPIALVHNTSITKGEVALEFNSSIPPIAEDQEDAIARKKRLRLLPDEVSEIRFYIPGSAKGAKKRSDKAKKPLVKNETGDLIKVDSEDEESGGQSDDGTTAAQVFHDSIKEKAEVGLAIGEVLCTLPDVLLFTPRGRFDIDLHADFLRLRGKTYDYRIAFSQVQKLYLLPKPDDIHCQFVVNIDPPIRQGQTRYPYLVMQFVKDEQMELDLNIDEETLKEKYEGTLKARYDDPAFEVVSNLFRGMTGKKVTTPGNYQSHDGQSAVKCNVKTNEGQLYFLEKALLFISKQPSLVAHSDISSVTFARVGGALPSARTFDLSVKLKGNEIVLFTGLNKEELESIEEFLRMKKIRVKNETEELAVAVDLAMGDGSDDGGDVEMQGLVGEELDEDSEVDEDFQASSESDTGGSGDDSDADAMDEDGKGPEKKKAKLG